MPPIAIQHCSVRHERVPIAHPVKTAFATMTERHAVFIEVRDADGRVGVGESWVNFPTWAWAERIAAFEQAIFPYIATQSIDSIEDAMAEAYRAFSGPAHQAGTIGPLIQALSAVEMALWDLSAQQENLPLAKLWFEAPHDKVRLYASGINSPLPLDLIDAHLECGVSLFKLKLGFGDAIDQANLQQLSQHVAGRAKLAVDVNRGWTFDKAVEWLPRLAELDIQWLEEPLKRTEEHRTTELRELSAVPIAGGENQLMADDAHFAESCALPVDILQPDITKYTLPHFALKLVKSDLGDTEVVPHFLGSAPGQAASLHLAAGCPRGLCEWDINRNPLRTDMFDEPFEIIDGCIAIPPTPGLGWRLKSR